MSGCCGGVAALACDHGEGETVRIEWTLPLSRVGVGQRRLGEGAGTLLPPPGGVAVSCLPCWGAQHSRSLSGRGLEGDARSGCDSCGPPQAHSLPPLACLPRQ